MIKKRVVETTIDEMFCDDCGSILDSSMYYNKCFVCNKDLCKKCSKTYTLIRDFYDDDDDKNCCEECRHRLQVLDDNIEAFKENKVDFINNGGNL